MLPPGPSTHRLIQTLQFTRDPFKFLDTCANRYGETFTIHITWFGNGNPMVVVSNPEQIKQAFTERDILLGGKGKVQLGRLLGGHSLFVLDGPEHIRHRTLLMPAFAQSEYLESYGRTMLRLANASIDTWPVGKEFDLVPIFKELTTQVLIRCVLGVDEQARVDRLAMLTRRTIEIAGSAILMFPQVHKDLGPWSPWGKFLRTRNQLYQAMDEEIAARRASPGTDILSVMVQARDENGTPMSEAELRDELLSVLVGGTDTTATALGWTLCSLLRDPSLCQKLREEVATIVEGGQLSPARVNELKLLDATVREGLRLPPGAQLVARVVTQPVQIGNYEVPAGWQVSPSMYLAHMRASAFRNPRRFDPERLLSSPPSVFEWLPFGGGAHRCIGQKFSSYQMKMVLATLFQRARLRLKPAFVVRPVRRAVTMAPKEVPVILDACN